MDGRVHWIATAALGVAAVFMTSFGGPAVLPLLLVAVIVVVTADRLVAVSGLLVGFGATWLLLLGRQASTGGIYDDGSIGFAIGIGALTLVAGLVALLPAAASMLHGGATRTR